MRLARRVVLITGGGHGIGRAYALRCAAEGASVAVIDIDEEAVSRTAADIITAGGVGLGRGPMSGISHR